MYIEETGGTDGDIKVTVDGEEYTAEAVSDLNHDGVDDTAVVQTDDGYLSFTDTTGDGDADLMRTLDERGAVVGTARFDSVSGEWVSTDPSHPSPADSRQGMSSTDVGSGMTVQTADGEQRLEGPLTDTDGDGRGDTLVVTDADGDTVVFADIDGDGDADVATEITGSGEVIVSEHRGDGEWVVVHDDHLDGGEPQRASAQDNQWDVDAAEDREFAAGRGPVHVDPATGEWVDTRR